MALYRYVKAPPQNSSGYLAALSIFPKRTGYLPVHIFSKRKLLATGFISFGAGILLFLSWPFVVWQLWWVPKMKTVEIARPLPAATAQENSGDSTQASTWFPGASQKSTISRVSSYTLSIPKLKIFEATTIIGGEDLSKSLIHWGGTALPGENGKTVIFGHSVLPQFFDPKNYKAIFSTLHTLEVGDKILVNFDGIEYKYEIYGMEIVEPQNIAVLGQQYDDSYLYLITCTPPGTYWKRLVVKARLQKI